MTNEEYIIKVNKAKDYVSKSRNIISKLVKKLAKEKGFKHWKLFDADFATGFEIIVSFNNECEDADMDMSYMLQNTKEEIIKRLIGAWYMHVSAETKKLLSE